MPITPRSDDLFLVVDLQHDFLPGGSLAVTGGDEIIIPINRLGRRRLPTSSSRRTGTRPATFPSPRAIRV